MDILSIAVWGALLCVPRTMLEWKTTEYTFAIQTDVWVNVHPSIALVDMAKVW